MKHLSTTCLFILGAAILVFAGVPQSAHADSGDDSLVHACLTLGLGFARIVGAGRLM